MAFGSTRRSSFRMSLVLCLAVLIATVVSSRPIEGGEEKLATHEEWVELVLEEAEKVRTSRSVPDEAYITDIHEHYRKAFQDIDDEASIQDVYNRPDHETTREKEIKGRYIVFLQDDVTDDKLDHIVDVLQRSNDNSNGRFVAKHIEKFRYVGKGFTATLSHSVVHILRKHPQSYTVESDMVIKRSSRHSQNIEDVLASVDMQEEHVEVKDDKSEAKNDKSEVKNDKSEVNTDQNNAVWNLDRLDQRKKTLDGVYLPKANGQGVDVYVLDTGIRYSHSDFGGRAKYLGYDAIDKLINKGTPKNGEDCNGHGTHCAGTIGGKTFGVAKEVTLYSARVLSCVGSGAVKGILDTIEYILKDRKEKGTKTRAVFNLSVGVKRLEAFNRGVNNAAKQGVVVVSASGNQHGDSCNYSPGSAELVISVAATDREDTSAPFSNIGKCTDIYAPGERIKSASMDCDTCVAVKSGTSMACPHVAGYAAIVLGQDSSLTPTQVKEQMIEDSTKSVVSMKIMAQLYLVNKTPNQLLFVGTDHSTNGN